LLLFFIFLFMANENQYKLWTKFVATRGVAEYRQSIQQWIKPQDKVLEIGCEWGTTSILINDVCKNLIATDISRDCIERARKMYPKIHFETLDAFNIRDAMKLGMDFTKIYIDMSGLSSYRSLLDVISLMNMYANVFKPEAIVIKSGSLKQFASHCIAFNSNKYFENK
jgi:2-polyprenyl-3-methyl-5-hydroxy-6-metoxy-1,4-benzoquinol methylase